MADRQNSCNCIFAGLPFWGKLLLVVIGGFLVLAYVVVRIFLKMCLACLRFGFDMWYRTRSRESRRQDRRLGVADRIVDTAYAFISEQSTSLQRNLKGGCTCQCTCRQGASQNEQSTEEDQIQEAIWRSLQEERMSNFAESSRCGCGVNPELRNRNRSWTSEDCSQLPLCSPTEERQCPYPCDDTYCWAMPTPSGFVDQSGSLYPSLESLSPEPSAPSINEDYFKQDAAQSSYTDSEQLYSVD